MLDILLRHGKNNPVLVGDAGVGKTAIAEALAQRIADGDVPMALRGVKLLALDHVALLAGTQFRGQYEERVQGIVEETTAAGNVILFVDELHNLMGQGVALGAAMDAANMLKPALVRGDFRVIGATTGVEYDRWIRGDPALERRFQPVNVRELDSDETLEILHARVPVLERHHDVVIHESAVVASVRLTDLFMQERRRPDRALDVLDEACAHTQGAIRLTTEAEALARTRRTLVREHQAKQGNVSDDVSAGARATEPGDPDTVALGPDIRLEIPEFARDGFAALERLGAELGALLDMPGARATGGERAPHERGTPPANGEDLTSRNSRRDTDGATAEPAAPRTLAEVEDELRTKLLEEGAVVRGHDIARVMTLITGKQISWVD